MCACVCMCAYASPHHQRLYYALLLAWPTCSPKHGSVWYSTHILPSAPHSPVVSAGPLHLPLPPELMLVNCHINSDLLARFVNNIKQARYVISRVIFALIAQRTHGLSSTMETTQTRCRPTPYLIGTKRAVA